MKWHMQFSRYALVGLVSNAIGYLLYLLLTYLGMGHKTAMTLLYIIGVLQTFYFNRNWSFKHHAVAQGSFVRYVFAYLFGYAINFVILWLGVDLLHLPHQGVQGFAIIMVATCLFLMHRYWVFAPLTRRSPA
jgi:putative flippase GtrA